MYKELREDICYDWLDADIYKKKKRIWENASNISEFLWVLWAAEDSAAVVTEIHCL